MMSAATLCRYITVMDRTSVDQIRLQKYTQNIPSDNEITISFIKWTGEKLEKLLVAMGNFLEKTRKSRVCARKITDGDEESLSCVTTYE